MLEPAYQDLVALLLDDIERDDARTELWNAIVNTLSLILDHEDSSEARRYSMRMPDGEPVWRVPVRPRTEDHDWSIIWEPNGKGEAVFHYVGPWPPVPLT